MSTIVKQVLIIQIFISGKTHVLHKQHYIYGYEY